MERYCLKNQDVDAGEVTAKACWSTFCNIAFREFHVRGGFGSRIGEFKEQYPRRETIHSYEKETYNKGRCTVIICASRAKIRKEARWLNKGYLQLY